MTQEINNFVYFGTDEFATTVLAELESLGIKPAMIITTPDSVVGRKQVLTPPPIKLWAQQQNIPLRQPDKLSSITSELESLGTQFFLVASYGKILPPEIIKIPPQGILNLHPSLLPKYRGPSPIQTAILNGDKKTGITLMLIDDKVDHGPTLGSVKYQTEMRDHIQVRKDLARLGAQLFARLIQDYLENKIKPIAQNHLQATYTKLVTKEDGKIDLQASGIVNYCKFLALNPWPGLYFINQSGKRIKIKTAKLENDLFVPKIVIPEGKNEMSWEDYQRGYDK